MGNSRQGASYDTSNVFDDPSLLYDDFDVERFLQHLESRDRRPGIRARRPRKLDDGAAIERPVERPRPKRS